MRRLGRPHLVLLLVDTLRADRTSPYGAPPEVTPELDRWARRGIVFEQGSPIGRATVSQATIGAQIGAQSYSQVIFFRDEPALRRFQRESFEFSAQATAVAATEGKSATTSYEAGVAVFNMARGGLMAEASVGGQKFRYWSL